MTQQVVFYILLALAGGALGGYQLKGYVDALKANRRTRLLAELAEDVAELESFKEDSGAVTAQAAREAADAATLGSLQARIAALK